LCDYLPSGDTGKAIGKSTRPDTLGNMAFALVAMILDYAHRT
jgi:hypothetical protein